MSQRTVRDVDFLNIVPRNGGKREAFEEFCCQIARRRPDIPPGGRFIRYHGAGGDGGVECVWRLPNGDEWGWQAKYLFDLRNLKSQVTESIETAVRIHPALKRYFICLPFNPTGPAGHGKSQQERLDEYLAEWTSLAAANECELELEYCTKSMLLDNLLDFDPDGGRLRFWFDSLILTDSWFASHIREAHLTAGPRYTPSLSISTPVGEAFEAFGQTDKWRDRLRPRLNQLTTLCKD